MSSLLGIAALAIAVVALVVSFAIPGPVGPTGANGATGATGQRGPAGAGTLMNYSMSAPWTSGGLPLVGCTNVLIVNLTVPSAGTIVISSTIHIWVDHTSGTEDLFTTQIATISTDCSTSNSNRIGIVIDVPASVATASVINQQGSSTNAFAVTAGPHTYYMNSQMQTGQSSGDKVSEASMVLVFYPA